MKKTPATENYPEIEWEDLKEELLDSDIDERMEVYRTTGMGTDGKTYSGSAYFFSGEFDDIKDIEEI